MNVRQIKLVSAIVRTNTPGYTDHEAACKACSTPATWERFRNAYNAVRGHGKKGWLPVRDAVLGLTADDWRQMQYYRPPEEET